MILNNNIRVRISDELFKRVDAYCKIKRIQNMSEFFRLAATNQIKPDISDETLVFESLKDVHEKMHQLENQQDIFFSFFCFFVKHFLLYTAEIPQEHQAAAALSAKDRYKSMMDNFRQELKMTPSRFESLLADFFEER